MSGSHVPFFAAGVIAVGASSLIRLLGLSVFLPELAAQTLFSVTPGEVESALIAVLGETAKYIAVIGAAVVNVALLAALGIALSYLFSDSRKLFASSAVITYVATLALLYSFSSLTEVSTQRIEFTSFFYQLVPSVLYSTTLTLTLDKNVAKREVVCVYRAAPVVQRRRLLIYALSSAALATAIVVYGLAPLLNRPAASVRYERKEDPLKGLLRYEVTPNELFYRVDVNIIPPRVDVNTWRLNVKGLVKREVSLSYSELMSLESVEQYATLECVSNEIGGDLISTALWKGVRLRDVLALAEPLEETRYVVFRCADGYDVAIPIDVALADGTIIAYEMNGEALPIEHGFPARVIVQGYYGMMNAKWVREIELVNEEYLGFWQRKGWVNDAKYQTHSFIVIPGESPVKKRFRSPKSPELRVGEKSVIAGIAFAGDRGISKVEVSIDGGKTWEPAMLKDPLSRLSWVIWAKEWIPEREGGQTIMVRATDGEGNVQTAEIRKPFPAGATGYHVIDVEVKSDSLNSL